MARKPKLTPGLVQTGLPFEGPEGASPASVTGLEVKGPSVPRKKARRAPAAEIQVQVSPERGNREPSVAELEREIARLEAEIAPTIKRLQQLRRVRATKKAGAESIISRQSTSQAKAERVIAAFNRHGGGRDAAQKVAREFPDLSERTIYRYISIGKARPLRG
jgi:septal ring factor EnvC (AmiA/AmiB activator)